MGFFKSFIASCKGPLSFAELRRQPGWKVILHLFLTVLLSCIFVGIGRYAALKYQWSRPERMFIESFGSGVTVSTSGILPEKDVDISRRQELPYDGLLIYVSPKGAEKSYPDETLEKRNFILLWTPGQVALAIRNRENNRWALAAFSGDAEAMMSKATASGIKENTDLPYAQMRKELFELAAKPLPKEFAGLEKRQFLSAADLFKAMRGGMAAINGGAYFRYASLLLFFGVLTYMAVFFLMERFSGAERRIPAAEMWKIVLYAACPVIVVVNVFPMLQLPFESFYEKIFLVGWIVYINVIKRYLEKNPTLLENPEE